MFQRIQGEKIDKITAEDPTRKIYKETLRTRDLNNEMKEQPRLELIGD